MADLEQKYKGLGIEMVRITTALRSQEKLNARQLHNIDHLEKVRDNLMKSAAENAEMVSVTADACTV